MVLNQIKNNSGQFLRDIVFGVNDAILTNLGIVSGFSLALQDRRFIIMACLVDIFISAFAMSFGTYMSRTSENDFLKTKLTKEVLSDTESAMGQPVIASVVMWFSYIIAGFIPVLPFLLGFSIQTALVVAMVLGLSSFFILGMIKGSLTKTAILKSGLIFLTFGTVSAIIGLIVGRIANQIS